MLNEKRLIHLALSLGTEIDKKKEDVELFSSLSDEKDEISEVGDISKEDELSDSAEDMLEEAEKGAKEEAKKSEGLKPDKVKLDKVKPSEDDGNKNIAILGEIKNSLKEIIELIKRQGGLVKKIRRGF